MKKTFEELNVIFDTMPMAEFTKITEDDGARDAFLAQHGWTWPEFDREMTALYLQIGNAHGN